MKQTLFNPDRIDLPPNLILIPQFWGKDYYQELKKKAYGCVNLISSDLLIFDDYSVAVNFLGYPHLLTLLEFIEDVRNKNIYFLGTAGTLNPGIRRPTPLAVEEIYSTEILEHFSTEKKFPLTLFKGENYRKAKGVTVDIIQRETAPWLRKQVERGIDFVEMEIFPLRAYLEKSFQAIVVTTDLLLETGIEVHPDKKLLQKEFINAYEAIVNSL